MHHFLKLLVITLLTTTAAQAAKIDQAFENLKVFNYFEAKAGFEKSLGKYEAPASFGLATIYARNDNPFFNLDSAYRYIVRSEQHYGAQSDKDKEKFRKYAVDYPAIAELRGKISSQFYQLALQRNSIVDFTAFLEAHPWAAERATALHKRDSMAYSAAGNLQTSAGYQEFLQIYPTSAYRELAQEGFYLKQYQEETKGGSVTVLLGFVKKFPENPYIGDAEDRIFDLQTRQNTVESFKSFLANYPTNRNAERAWRKLYQLYMSDYSESRIRQFRIDYPNYPFMQEVEKDIELSKQELLPFKQGALFGFMNYNGDIVFPATYESLGFFREGLALAAKNGLYGYVDKANKVVIPFQFDSGTDFEEGRAIVGKDEKEGIIDRTGKRLFEIKFEDIGQFSEGLIYGQKDSLYAFYDKYGFQRIGERFHEAFSFSNGLARVQLGDNQAFVDPYGSYIVPPAYEEIAFFSDTLLTFREGEFYGIMRRNCQIVHPAVYDRIGTLSNNRAIFVKDGKIGYFNSVAKVVINAAFEEFPNAMEASRFDGNYAKVKFKDKYGVIDANGKWIVPATYLALGNVAKFMAFSKGKQWGFIDLTNKVVLPPVYEYAESFDNNLAVVEALTRQGVINAKGTWVIPAEFTDIKKIDSKHFLASRGANFGVYSSTGQLLVPLNYQQIRQVEKDFLVLTTAGQVHYFYLPEEKLIIPQSVGE